MTRSYPRSDEAVVDRQRREFLIDRCGSRPGSGHTSQKLAPGGLGEMIGKERGRKQGTSLSQSGDLDGMRDEHTTKGESSYAENLSLIHI